MVLFHTTLIKKANLNQAVATIMKITMTMGMTIANHPMKTTITTEEIQEIMDIQTSADMAVTLEDMELEITPFSEITFRFDFIASIIL